jgi:signal transduction histidine kinase
VSWGPDEMWAALTEQAPVLMVVMEGDELRFTYATKAVRELMRHELIGHSLHDVLRGSAAIPIVERVYATGVAETVSDMPLFSDVPVHANRFFTRTFTPLRDHDGAVRGVAIHAYEVTKEVGKRHALQASELRSRDEFQRMFSLYDEVPVYLAVLEPPGWKLTRMNRRCRELFGERKFLGVNLVDLVPPTNAVRIKLDQVHATGRTLTFETVATLAGFAGRAFSITLVPISAPDGRITAVMVAALEITEQRRAQQEIETARQEAVAATRAKDQFLAMLGHELRNPLQPMLTGVQLMRLDGQRGPALDMLEREVMYVTRLVEDLLDISRISRGMLTLKRDSLDVHTIVNRGLELASPLLEQTGHRVTTDIQVGNLGVLGDPHRLAQVVSNLIQNAAKYSARGSAIRVAAHRMNDRIVLRIVDDGVGIEADMLQRVFDAFVQGDQALDRSRGGLGLGLSIVKSLVHAHGGSVSVHSDGPGCGSTFTVELPSIELAPPAATDAPLARRRDPSLAPIRVLVVDDNAHAVDMLELGLARLGYQVSVAYDGPSAIVLAKSKPPMIALLDLGLPVMDGYELGEILRAEHAIPIVVISGYGQPADLERSKAAGFAAHLVKPVEIGDVAALIDKLVG